MAAQAEEIAVIIADRRLAGLGQAVPFRDQAGAGAVFEAAVALPDHQCLELVIRHWRGLAEESDVVLANGGKVFAKAGFVAAEASTQDHVVGYATGLEGNARERAHFHRVIDQIVVIIGLVQTEFIGFGRLARQ